MERFEQLKDMHRHAWNMLFQAAVKRNHPMRTPALATHSASGPRVRTVVLRAADTQTHQLFFFTDIRSHKAEQLGQDGGRIATLYWDPNKKIQIRCRGTATLQQGTERCREFWNHLSAAGRSAYATTLSPGTEVDHYTTGLPEGWSNNWPAGKTDFAFEHFALLVQEVTEVEVLHLEQEGHQRGLFIRKGNGQWAMTWLIP